MISLDYFLYSGTRWVPSGEILYPYSCPRVKFHNHTLTSRVGYPRVPAPVGKIDIPSRLFLSPVPSLGSFIPLEASIRTTAS